MLSKSKIFLILCLGFIAGVWLGKYANLEIMALLAMFFVVIATLGWQSKLAKLAGFAGIVLVLGMGRIYFSLDENKLVPFYGQTLNVQGLITEEPDVRSDKTYLTLGRLKIESEEVDSKILLTVPKFPEYKYGNVLKLTAKIQEPRDAETKGEFSYKNYLSKSGIEAVVYYPKIEVLAENQGNVVKASLLALKQRFIRAISEILPEPHNSFLAGLLVGLRRGIPQDLLENFNITGTTHIIALSGFNITIIARAVDGVLLNWFRRRISFALSLICIASFVIMTGASASVVRAAIMGILAMLALNIGRVKAINNAMAFTGAVMVGLNPKILHFDLGFQLSFLALMGLVYLAPKLEPYFLRLWKWLREILVATLSAQIFVIPVLLLNFDRLSLVAPLTNVLILLVIPFAMLFGFLGGLAGLVWKALALPFVWVAWAMLEYIIWIVEWTAKIPFASINYESFAVWMLILYYAVLIAFLNRRFLQELWIRLLRRPFGLLANAPTVPVSARSETTKQSIPED
ncbi:MAG: ComEC family competence protein [Candidatus Doudnabacteria bacterium]|nr:ComEC family competence protein [Candidatus Doudnabacteria bacterium]